MDRKDAMALQERIKNALVREFGADSVRFDAGTIRANSILAKFEITPGTPTEVADAKKSHWASLCKRLDPRLTDTDFNRSFTMNRATYKVAGCDPSKPKYSINVERHDGKMFRMAAHSVATALRAMDALAPAPDPLTPRHAPPSVTSLPPIPVGSGTAW